MSSSPIFETKSVVHTDHDSTIVEFEDGTIRPETGTEPLDRGLIEMGSIRGSWSAAVTYCQPQRVGLLSVRPSDSG